MDAINCNFLCNNVKGLQTSKKHLKLFNYFKNKMFPNGILFLQETHSRKENEIKWKHEFDFDLYFSHGKSNSCCVLTGFSGNKTFTVNKRLCDENGRILILETLIDNSEFILVNLFNANPKSEQIKPFIELNTLLLNVDLSSEKHIIFAGDLNLFFDHSLYAKGGSPNLKKNTL